MSVRLNNLDSFEAQFNLGVVFKNQDKLEMATSHFERAVEIRPNDVEANFEYGVMLYKTGVKSRAEIQYEFLLNLDEAKAEKLRKIINGQQPPPIKVQKASK
ncbi:MAG: tetratricopeptide repeat protein [Blastocatellia bacterium]|nr:tetratricopeptide repeat protein [Blastocatellia bacterium]